MFQLSRAVNNGRIKEVMEDMGMLKSISLENYKCFKEKTDIEIAPLTVLCGVNSSGKSSILKSLLMLKQSYENGSLFNSLSLNGNYTNNGLFKDVVYNHKGKDFVICNKFEFRKDNYLSTGERQALEELDRIYFRDNYNEEILKIAVLSVKFVISGQNRRNLSYGDNIIENILITISIDGSNDSSIEFRHIEGKLYNVFTTNFPGTKTDLILKNTFCYFENFRIVDMFFESVEPNQYVDNLISNIYSVFRIISLQYRDIKYISPLRHNPERRYIVEQDTDGVGIHGEYTPQIIDKQKEINARINDIPTDNGFFPKYIPIKQKNADAINKWLNYIGVKNYNIYSNEDLIRLTIGTENILDVGFGISQLLPILVNCVVSPFKTTTLLEQPEVHLHPKMQMNVADLLIATSLAHKNVIVETHSDHIINRIVKRIIQDKSGKLKDNIEILYLSHDVNNNVIFYPITIDDSKGIVNWPDGFFDQFQNEQEEILRAGIEKRKFLYEHNIHG